MFVNEMSYVNSRMTSFCPQPLPQTLERWGLSIALKRRCSIHSALFSSRAFHSFVKGRSLDAKSHLQFTHLIFAMKSLLTLLILSLPLLDAKAIDRLKVPPPLRSALILSETRRPNRKCPHSPTGRSSERIPTRRSKRHPRGRPSPLPHVPA